MGWSGAALIKPPAHTARPRPPRRVRHTPREARTIQAAPDIPRTPLTRRTRRRPPTLAETEGLRAIPGRGEEVEAVAAPLPPAKGALPFPGELTLWRRPKGSGSRLCQRVDASNKLSPGRVIGVTLAFPYTALS